MKQPSFNLPSSGESLDHKVAPREPLFWFRKFCILSKFSPNPEDVVREINFHPGLNIVWSKAADVTADDAQSRTAGHASGKTTLCRLLRGLLGEPHFVDADFLLSARKTCLGWWFAAEIRIGGESWCVARPLCDKGVLAARCEHLHDFLSNPGVPDREGFEEALMSAAREITPVREFPGGTQMQPWSFFPWFIRDQNAQFAAADDWGSSSGGGTGAPLLSGIEKSILMRSVFDPSVTEEVQLLDRSKSIETEIENQKRSAKAVRQMLGKDEERVAALFGDESFLNYQGDLWIAAAEAECNRKLDELRDACSETAEEHEAREAYLQASSEFDFRAEDYRAGVRRRKLFFKKNREYLNRAPTPPKEPPGEEEVMIMVRRHPERRFCGVEMERARECQCQLALENEARNPPDVESERNLAANLHSAPVALDCSDQYRRICTIADEAEAAYEEAKEACDNAEKRWLALKKAGEKERIKKAEMEGKKSEALERLRQDRAEEQRLSQEGIAYAVEKKEVLDRLADIRKASSRSLGAFRQCFNETLRFVYGESATGEVQMRKGKIRLGASVGNSTRNGAALNAGNVVCFDLALLALAADGKCTHPGFLVHDGPRVADLSPAIYRRYFEFAQVLANRGDSPNFQYIVTTTTNPPEEFQGDDYVVCRLDASTVDGRLLRRNLS